MPTPSDLRCQAAALRHAARRAHKRSVGAALLARARRLEAEAAFLEHAADKPTGEEAMGPPKPPPRL